MVVIFRSDSLLNNGEAMQRPFLKIGILGLIVIAWGGFLMLVFPSQVAEMPPGFSTPIIAFEFIKSAEEASNLFRSTASIDGSQIKQAMDLGNRLDYVYMFLYSAFLFFFAYTVSTTYNIPIYRLGMLLAAVALLGDAMENLQLLGITSGLPSGEIQAELDALQLWTWIKWGSLALYFLLFSTYFKTGGCYSKLIAILGIIPVVLGLAAFFHRSQLNELFAVSVMSMFLLIIIYCFVHKTPSTTEQS